MLKVRIFNDICSKCQERIKVKFENEEKIKTESINEDDEEIEDDQYIEFRYFLRSQQICLKCITHTLPDNFIDFKIIMQHDSNDDRICIESDNGSFNLNTKTPKT